MRNGDLLKFEKGFSVPVWLNHEVSKSWNILACDRPIAWLISWLTWHMPEALGEINVSLIEQLQQTSKINDDDHVEIYYARKIETIQLKIIS